MKERPILFSSPMVQAILAGNKTQTRRVVNFPLSRSEYEPSIWQAQQKIKKDVKNKEGKTIIKKGELAFMSMTIEGVLSLCPYGQVGDRLWVRETWACVSQCSDGMNRSVVCVENYAEHGWTIQYRASTHCEFEGNWRPSIFMPRKYSRILLEITGVRVERLHDISEQDAIAEGIGFDVIDQAIYFKNYMSKSHFADDDFCDWDINDAPKKSYFSLWESINGRKSLDANPWVWVIEFKSLQVLKP